MILAIIAAIAVAAIGLFLLFIFASLAGTFLGIGTGIVKGRAARRTAAAAGVPYPRITYKQARAARLARQQGPCHMGPLRQSARQQRLDQQAAQIAHNIAATRAAAAEQEPQA